MTFLYYVHFSRAVYQCVNQKRERNQKEKLSFRFIKRIHITWAKEEGVVGGEGIYKPRRKRSFYARLFNTPANSLKLYIAIYFQRTRERERERGFFFCMTFAKAAKRGFR